MLSGWGAYFSAAASSEKDQGSMNLDSKTAPFSPTRPSPSYSAATEGNGDPPTEFWGRVSGILEANRYLKSCEEIVP